MTEFFAAPKAAAPGARAVASEGAGDKGPKPPARGDPFERLRTLEKVLNAIFYGRGDEVRASILGLATGYPVFLMSPPGTAKTAIVDTIAKLVDGAKYFYYLLTRYTEPAELLGPLDISALRQGVYKRITTNKLPEAHIVFLDEVFKASSAVRNILLDIILNKRVVNGTGVIKIPMKALFTASNELPKDEEDEAFYDRLVIRRFFNYLPDEELDKLLDRAVLVTAGAIDVSKPVLTLTDIDAAQDAVKRRAVKLRKSKAASVYIKAVAAVRAAGIPYSDRRVAQGFMVAVALALLRGRNEPSIIDIADALMLVAPMTPEHVAAVEEALEKADIYGNTQLISQIKELIDQADTLAREYKQDQRVTTLASLGQVLQEIEKLAKTADYVPPNLVKKIEALVSFYTEEVEKLKRL